MLSAGTVSTDTASRTGTRAVTSPFVALEQSECVAQLRLSADGSRAEHYAAHREMLALCTELLDVLMFCQSRVVTDGQKIVLAEFGLSCALFVVAHGHATDIHTAACDEADTTCHGIATIATSYKVTLDQGTNIVYTTGSPMRSKWSLSGSTFTWDGISPDCYGLRERRG